jgi:hypothetical protein
MLHSFAIRDFDPVKQISANCLCCICVHFLPLCRIPFDTYDRVNYFLCLMDACGDGALELLSI